MRRGLSQIGTCARPRCPQFRGRHKRDFLSELSSSEASHAQLTEQEVAPRPDVALVPARRAGQGGREQSRRRRAWSDRRDGAERRQPLLVSSARANGIMRRCPKRFAELGARGAQKSAAATELIYMPGKAPKPWPFSLDSQIRHARACCPTCDRYVGGASASRAATLAGAEPRRTRAAGRRERPAGPEIARRHPNRWARCRLHQIATVCAGLVLLPHLQGDDQETAPAGAARDGLHRLMRRSQIQSLQALERARGRGGVDPGMRARVRRPDRGRRDLGRDGRSHAGISRGAPVRAHSRSCNSKLGFPRLS
jgi:hypothetical protein